jgi:sugar lactone lactonase YvrE
MTRHSLFSHFLILVAVLLALTPSTGHAASLSQLASAGLSPYGVALDQQGRLYVTDPDHAHLLQYSPSHHLLHVWGSLGHGPGQFVAPEGVAVDHHNTIYVNDSGNSRIVRLSAQGKVLGQFGSFGHRPGQFIMEHDLAVDAQDHVYVLDQQDLDHSRIEQFTATGRLLAIYSLDGLNLTGKGYEAHGLAVDRWGRLYTAITDRWNVWVQQLSSHGIPLHRFGSYGTGWGQLQRPGGIAVDAQGTVAVSDADGAVVQRYRADGTPLSRWGSFGHGVGQLNVPIGLALDSSGGLYVADSFNARIQWFSGATGVARWSSFS